MRRSRQLRVLQDGAAPPPAEADAARDLPILHEADLDWDALDCVLADLDDFTDVRELQGRVGNGSPIALDDLLDARNRLVAGDLEGLQIIYRFADQVWVDTLLRQPNGARLLRMLSQR